MKAWRSLNCKKNEIRLDITLACGQSFRWRETLPGEWTSVFAGHIWTLSQTDDQILYKVHTDKSIDTGKLAAHAEKISVEHLIKQEFEDQEKSKNTDIEKVIKRPKRSQRVTSKSSNAKETKPDISDSKTGVKLLCDGEDISKTSTCFQKILHNYLQLDVNLSELYKQWSGSDTNFKHKAAEFTGVRMLRQDPVENLFSFICSSNNNIARISQMVDKMCRTFGEQVGELNGEAYHAFPSVRTLSQPGVEDTLRGLGFGYRAKFIAQSARHMEENESPDWLVGLRDRPYPEAKAELIKLCGVGAKVADCICLMSLDKTEAIPVDTHVWQIVTRDYPEAGVSANKTLTDKTYREIGDFFKGLWGDYAGWAHSVLFSADLRKFKDTSPVKVKDIVKKKKKKEDSPQKSKKIRS